MPSMHGGGSSPSAEGSDGSSSGAGEDRGAACRAGCDRSCPSGDQAAYDQCRNEINSCRIGCP